MSDRSRVKSVRVPLGALDVAGGLLSWQNPETGRDIAILGIELDVTTKTTAACTGDFGTTPTSGATLSDNLIDGLDLNAATGFFNNTEDKGTNGKSKQRLGVGKWLTGSKASGAAAGLVGFAFIQYIVLQ